MNIRTALAATFMLTMALHAGSAVAGTANTPPGNPCAGMTGNPCNENNGNLGRQGNANHERVRIDKKPPPIDFGMPAISRNAAYIDQIGDANVAEVRQTARVAYANVEQNGTANTVVLSQDGTGVAYADARQTGTDNYAKIQQSGTGQNAAYVTQNGSSNWAWANQNAAGAVHNGARMTQTGNNNDMALTQAGSDNLAVLTQEGDGNGMSATQLGDGNRLAWSQQGTGLTDLQIVQTGGAEKGGQLAITQTGVNSGN